jgi:hypothetical protein
MIFRILLAWTAIGAILGFLYARSQTAASAAHAIEIIRSTPVRDGGDFAKRQRAKAIAETRGARRKGSLIGASVGAAVGLGLGLITIGVMWMGSLRLA